MYIFHISACLVMAFTGTSQIQIKPSDDLVAFIPFSLFIATKQRYLGKGFQNQFRGTVVIGCGNFDKHIPLICYKATPILFVLVSKMKRLNHKIMTRNYIIQKQLKLENDSLENLYFQKNVMLLSSIGGGCGKL